MDILGDFFFSYTALHPGATVEVTEKFYFNYVGSEVHLKICILDIMGIRN